MMYEALLFDMNALGDIPDKDFTSRASLAGSRGWRKGTEAEAGSPPSLEARTSHFQGGRDRVALAFKLLGPEPHVSHPHKQQSVDRGSHTAESTRNGLGAETAELGSQPDSLKQTLEGEAWDPAFSNEVPPAPARGSYSRIGRAAPRVFSRLLSSIAISSIFKPERQTLVLRLDDGLMGVHESSLSAC